MSVTLTSKFEANISIKSNVVPQITGIIQRTPVPIKERSFLQKHYELADSLPYNIQTSSIGILIGNDYYHDIIMKKRAEVQDGLHVIESKLGWILTGRLANSETNVPEHNLFVMTQTTSQLPSEIHLMNAANKSTVTQPIIEDLWSLESIGINPKSKEERDNLVVESFKKTISRQPDGRYEVCCPWRKENPDIQDNYRLALRRLKSLIKRFDQNKTLRQQYDDITKEQLKKGIIEEVNGKEISGKPRHYIPHHVVITPEKSTTKVRVVYDASAKTNKESLSLNECLHRGPVILEDLCGILLRFRTTKIGIIADIEKAFLQVALNQRDRDVTGLLWLKDINRCATKDNIQTYRFTRLPLFLLSGTISHHLELDASDTAIQVKDYIYVDNLITGADNEKDILELYQNCRKIFGEASMNLRDWLWNSQKLNCNFTEEDKMKEEITRVLGLLWNVKFDTYLFRQRSLSTCKWLLLNGQS